MFTWLMQLVTAVLLLYAIGPVDQPERRPSVEDHRPVVTPNTDQPDAGSASLWDLWAPHRPVMGIRIPAKTNEVESLQEGSQIFGCRFVFP